MGTRLYVGNLSYNVTEPELRDVFAEGGKNVVEVKVVMDFAAAPRCSKVLDFGKNVPDPVYGGAAVLQALTFGMWKAQPFHDHLDLGMVGQHARVHQALMDGSAKTWTEFVNNSGK